MNQLKELQTLEELEEVWEKSSDKQVILFKHSTTCPISAGAFAEYQSFLKSEELDVDCYLVKVIESRDVSKHIEAKTKVKHESPQIFLIENKEVVWHTSHSKITRDNIKDNLKAD